MYCRLCCFRNSEVASVNVSPTVLLIVMWLGGLEMSSILACLITSDLAALEGFCFRKNLFSEAKQIHQRILATIPGEIVAPLFFLSVFANGGENDISRLGFFGRVRRFWRPALSWQIPNFHRSCQDWLEICHFPIFNMGRALEGRRLKGEKCGCYLATGYEYEIIWGGCSTNCRICGCEF